MYADTFHMSKCIFSVLKISLPVQVQQSRCNLYHSALQLLNVFFLNVQCVRILVEYKVRYNYVQNVEIGSRYPSSQSGPVDAWIINLALFD